MVEWLPAIAVLLILASCAGPGSPTKETDALESTPPPVDTADSADHTGETGETDDSADSADTEDTDDSGSIDTGPVVCDRSLPWMFVEAGVQLTCGIHTDGCAECWGRGKEDEDADYSWDGEDRPPPGAYSSIDLGNWVDFSTGGDSGACGLLQDGSLSCWKWGRYTDPGPYTALQVYDAGGYALTPTGELVTWGGVGVPSEGTFLTVAAGPYEAFAIQTGGALRRWSPNIYPGTNESTIEGNWTDVDVGHESCALDSGGGVLCWNLYGEVVQLQGEKPTGPFTNICVTGVYTACVLDATGAPTCWGGWPAILETTPTDASLTSIACGLAHVCGITTDNDILCWGEDSYGETVPPT